MRRITMITEATTLTCKFKDNLGTNRTLTIDNPKEALTPDEISEFMHFLIDSDLLMASPKVPDSQFSFINGAAIIRRTTETIELN